VPAVNVVTLYEPSVAVLPVNPAPIVIVPSEVRYLRITTPEPPLPPAAAFVETSSPLRALPPPPPKFAVPAFPATFPE
jgi:hypothetical protein